MWLSDGKPVWPKDNPELTFLFALILFALFFAVHLRRGVGGGKRSCSVDASLTSQSGSRQAAHTGGRLLSELAASQMPPGECQSPACESANRMGGIVRIANRNLTSCPPSPPRDWCFPSSPECGGGNYIGQRVG